VFSYQLEVLEDIQKDNFNARASQVLKQETMIKDLLIEQKLKEESKESVEGIKLE
jgi:hypothetical protein